jgi:hypothetical protein
MIYGLIEAATSVRADSTDNYVFVKFIKWWQKCPGMDCFLCKNHIGLCRNVQVIMDYF